MAKRVNVSLDERHEHMLRPVRAELAGRGLQSGAADALRWLLERDHEARERAAAFGAGVGTEVAHGRS